MSTIASRVFRSSPHRDSSQTWAAIVDLLTRGNDSAKRTELLSISGIAASVIAERGPRDSAVIVTCDGPRTRVYCLYDEDAIDGADANEEQLGFDPLKGDWRVSLPSPEADLAWVQAALKKHSVRITARDIAAANDIEENASAMSETLVLDPKGFLKP